MKTTFCVSMYFEAVQGPNLNGWPYGHRSISQPNINVDIWLRNCWFCNNDQPFFNIDISTSNLADFWLNCGWEVDFWLIIVTKSTISQPNINVEDGWGKLRLNIESTLRSWSVPTGGDWIWSTYLQLPVLDRLAPSFEWSRSPTKSHTRGKNSGTLCTESPSSVSILVTVVIPAIIGPSEGRPNYWLHNHHVNASRLSRMNRWIAIWPKFVAILGGGNWEELCVKCNAGFRLTCRLPHYRFDDDICLTAQAPLAAEGWPSGKQRPANRSITLPLCPSRQIADSWILFNSGAMPLGDKAKAALPLRAATLKQQAMITRHSGNAAS